MTMATTSLGFLGAAARRVQASNTDRTVFFMSVASAYHAAQGGPGRPALADSHRLSPVSAPHPIAAAVMPPFGSDPLRAATRRTNPAAVGPTPVVTAPIPISVRPDKANAGGPA